MPQITTAGNSLTACLQLILDKGYYIETHDNHDKSIEYYVASKQGHHYSAEDPFALLSLITLGETWGDQWKDKGLGKDPWSKIEMYDKNGKIRN